MLTLISPFFPLIFRIVCVLAFIGGIFAIETKWEASVEKRGFDKATVIRDAQDAAMLKKANDDIAALKMQYQKQDEDLRQENAKKDYERETQRRSYEATIQSLRHDVSTGAIKLRINTANPTTSCASSAPDTGPAAGSSDQKGSEVMPETADDILGIAGGIASTVRDYNELVDRYNAVKKVCSK